MSTATLSATTLCHSCRCRLGAVKQADCWDAHLKRATHPPNPTPRSSEAAPACTELQQHMQVTLLLARCPSASNPTVSPLRQQSRGHLTGTANEAVWTQLVASVWGKRAERRGVATKSIKQRGLDVCSYPCVKLEALASGVEERHDLIIPQPR